MYVSPIDSVAIVGGSCLSISSSLLLLVQFLVGQSFRLQGLPNIYVDWSLAVVLQVCKNSKNLSDEDNCNSGDYDDTIDANSLHILYDLFSFTRNLTNFQTSVAQVVLK